MKIGVIREEKIPHDKRVAFTPDQCVKLVTEFNVEVAVQPSTYRCFSDAEYLQKGVKIKEDLSDCDILMGIKEVPPAFQVPEKKYLFFSHTIKEQPHNKELIRSLLNKKITMVDYECLVDEQDNRVIGFGRYAGIVGAYNGLMAYGLKYKLYNLKPADQSHDKKELFEGLSKVGLPNVKIIVTGGGRVANGAQETLGAMNIRKVTPYEFLNYSFREPVYVQLHSHDYYEERSGKPFSKFDFYNHPENFKSAFNKYAAICDILIHCAYWDPHAPVLFTLKEMKDPGFRISVIADVTCDINGSIPSTVKPTTIEDKFYGFNPMDGEVKTPFLLGNVTVMAIDNLPCELPRDASEGFGKHLLERVIPELTGATDTGLIPRATICEEGKLTPRFAYLKNYAGV